MEISRTLNKVGIRIVSVCLRPSRSTLTIIISSKTINSGRFGVSNRRQISISGDRRQVFSLGFRISSNNRHPCGDSNRISSRTILGLTKVSSNRLILVSTKLLSLRGCSRMLLGDLPLQQGFRLFSQA